MNSCKRRLIATSLACSFAFTANLLYSQSPLSDVQLSNDSNAELLEDTASLAQVLRDWHASIGKAILEAWGFPEEVASAVGDQDDIDRSAGGQVDLTDVLTVSIMIADYAAHPADLELNMQGVRGFRRLGLDGEACNRILHESERDIADLRRALGA